MKITVIYGHLSRGNMILWVANIISAVGRRWTGQYLVDWHKSSGFSSPIINTADAIDDEWFFNREIM